MQIIDPMATSPRRLTTRERERLRRRLIDGVTQLYRSVHSDLRESTVAGVFFEQEQPLDEGDESLRDQLRDLRLSLAEGDARRAQAMEGALRRLQQGSYGICAECGNEIEIERLRAVPWAVRCIECQEGLESSSRQRAPTF